jgi:hypothetical protein
MTIGDLLATTEEADDQQLFPNRPGLNLTTHIALKGPSSDCRIPCLLDE